MILFINTIREEQKILLSLYRHEAQRRLRGEAQRRRRGGSTY
jgi:hypothetical protein